jgi:hypothetical protein
MFCPFYLLNLSLFIKCSPLADIFESWCDVVLMIGFIYYKGIGSAEFQSFSIIVGRAGVGPQRVSLGTNDP